MATDVCGVHTSTLTLILRLLVVALLLTCHSDAFTWRRKRSPPRWGCGATVRAAPTRSPPALRGNQQNAAEDETALLEFDVSRLLDIGTADSNDSLDRGKKRMKLLSSVVSAADNAGDGKDDEDERRKPTETFQQDDDHPLALPRHIASMRPFLCISDDPEVRNEAGLHLQCRLYENFGTRLTSQIRFIGEI